MTLDRFYTLCAALPGAEETFPFGPEVLVFKVGGRMFALVNIEKGPPSAALKCDPEQAVELRAQYEGVRPGYHMNKANWNSVDLDSDVPNELIRRMIEESYRLIVERLPKAKRPPTARDDASAPDEAAGRETDGGTA